MNAFNYSTWNIIIFYYVIISLTNSQAFAKIHTDPYRAAIIVGSNQPIGSQKALRYSHLDADKMAQTLIDVGKFSKEHIIVLKDPNPTALLSVMDHTLGKLEQQGQETMLFFYYSGHADDHAIYPQGQALALSELKKRLTSQQAKLRIGFIDACYGGSWTRAKGFTQEAPFAVNLPEELNNEGSVFIASSSGQESAHESETIHGSFFTHYFTTGLRGAADQSGDGEITLAEAFQYAKQYTIRDSVQFAQTTQHPSFAMNLRGREDLVLAHINDSKSIVEIKQNTGPLSIIHLSSGVLLLESDPGPKSIKIVLPPGRYLIKKGTDKEGYYAKEIEISKEQMIVIQEQQLTRLERLPLAMKGEENDTKKEEELNPEPQEFYGELPTQTPLWALSSLPKKRLMAQFSLGVNYSPTVKTGFHLGSGSEGFGLDAHFAVGITHRWQYIFPGLFTFRARTAGRTETNFYWGVSYFGLDFFKTQTCSNNTVGISFNVCKEYQYRSIDAKFKIGLDTRFWLKQGRAGSIFLGTSATVSGLFLLELKEHMHNFNVPHILTELNIGYGILIKNKFSLHIFENTYYESQGTSSSVNFALGSVSTYAGRKMPIFAWLITPQISLDLYAGIITSFYTQKPFSINRIPLNNSNKDIAFFYNVMLGATFLF